MLSLTADNTKEFMSLLLKQSVFDGFLLRSAVIETFASFEISGKLEKEYFTLDEQAQINRHFCLWSEIRPYVFQLIKGKRLPKKIKIVLSLEEEKMAALFPKASALFLNISFENGKITLVTGASEKSFSMDKSLEYAWDTYIKEFLKQNQIAVW